MEYVIRDVRSGFTSVRAKKECIIAWYTGVIKYHNFVHSPIFQVTLCFSDASFHKFAAMTLDIPSHWKIAKGLKEKDPVIIT